jgi:hypothetical protein
MSPFRNDSICPQRSRKKFSFFHSISSIPWIMKLSAAFEILIDLTMAIRAALPSTLSAMWSDPILLVRPTALSRIFMASVWIAFGDSVDVGARRVKEALIAADAFGVVLDLGAGVLFPPLRLS